MRRDALSKIKRAHVLRVYMEGGLKAATPLAIEYGINPNSISKMAHNSGLTIGEAKKQRASAAITAMLAEFKIGRYDLLESKYPEHVRFRSIAIKRLHRMRLGYSAIAAAMNIRESTVRYWLVPDFRSGEKLRSKNHIAKRRERHAIALVVPPSEPHHQ